MPRIWRIIWPLTRSWPAAGTWMVKKDLIQQENWAEITRLSREAVRTMLGFSLDHVGINCGSEAEADPGWPRTLCDMFGFSYQMGNSSVAGPPRRGVYQDPRPWHPRTHRHCHQQRGPGGVSSGPVRHRACRRPARRMPRETPRPFISTVNSAASPFIWFADKEESL